MEEELTARSMSSSVVSGRRRRRRIDRGELRWPATETAMVAALQHVREVRSSTRRWRGLWRSSEAGRGGEGKPVATVMPVGGGGGSRVRGRESRGRRGGRGRVRAVRGSCVASSGASRESGEAGGGQQGGGGARACRRASGTRRSPVGREDDRGGGARRAGPPPGWPACCCWAAQGRGGPGKPLLVLILFSIFF